MKSIIMVLLLLACFSVNAQHQHHTETKKVPEKTTTKKPVKKSTPAKKPVTKPTKDTGHAHKADSTSKTHVHHLSDSTVIVHDANHNEVKDTTHPKGHQHMADTMHMHKPDSASKTHVHKLDDSTIIVHDANHNEVKDTTHPKEHQHMADTMHHPHGVDTTGNMNQHDMGTMHNMHEGHMMHDNMNHAFSLNLPMSRNGSGTGWLPDASPMFGYMFHTPKWMYMLHGNLFIRYTNQDFSNKGSRGDAMVDAPNWLMFMGQRKVGQNGLFHFNTMFSLDAVIAGKRGYPLLFQSGELANGQPLVDRQHPHDLFSELSVSYSHAISKKVDVLGYVGYAGEPALGPVAFMHRPSALPNPDAPISHHWVDATHITFGVATLGIRLGDFKIEGSSFTGREPDENRYNFDKPRFDSWSGRLSFNPSANWALQMSHAFVKSPETLHPDEDINRSSASAIYSKSLSKGSVNATVLWGMNKSKGHTGENAILAELAWLHNKLTLHSRYEWVQKSLHELVLDESVFGHDAVFPVNAFTAGFNYDLLEISKTRLALGSQFTYYSADNRLNSLYGKNPMAVEVYLRIYPSRMR